MINLQHALILSSILFVLGMVSLVLRRNFLFILIGIEIMINAAALALVAAGSFWGGADGQIMYILSISLASGEVSIGLALLLRVYRNRQTLDIDDLSEMKG